jgi:hypothetical protein
MKNIPQFQERNLETLVDGAEAVFTGDVDGDGDIDRTYAQALYLVGANAIYPYIWRFKG